MSVRVMAAPGAGDIGGVAERARRAGIEDGVLFQTSGSGGDPKWVVLSEEALAASARAVNKRLGVDSGDRWLRALPEYHVGGFAIGVRATLAGASQFEFTGGWEPRQFAEHCRGATLCSLVPTQVFDLVRAGVCAPESLRAVLVGGGAFEPQLRERALGLGWPVRGTYGLTEAGSSVAIEDSGGSLELLDCWQARVTPGNVLEIAGEPLFSGYLVGDELRSPFAEGWFRTSDLADLGGRSLRILGRRDAVIKVLGEQVDLDLLQSRLESLGGGDFAIVACDDHRTGQRLLLAAAESGGDELMREFNSGVHGYQRLQEVVTVERIPRSSLGKVLREELVAQIRENTSEA